MVLVTFPGNDALLSCNHHSNAGSVWLFNSAQEALVELDAESLSCALFSKLSNCGQTRKLRHRNLWALTRRERARLGSRQSLPCGAAWASKFLNLRPQYRPQRRIFSECPRLMAQVPTQKLSDGDAQIRHLPIVIRRSAPFSSRPAPPTELPCYERFPKW